MGHSISAIILKPTCSRDAAAVHGLNAISLTPQLTMLPLLASWVDQLEARLGLRSEIVDGHRPLLDTPAVRAVARALAPQGAFAIIETDYFGGNGDQAAVVYSAEALLMPAEVGGIGPINKALRSLGVFRRGGRDEFDVVGLGRYRSFD